MRKRRFLSILLSLSILFSVLPIMGVTAETQYNYNDARLTGVIENDETSLPRYTLELFKENEEGNLVKTTAKDVRTNPNDLFYVAVKTTHFDRFTAMPAYGLSNLTIHLIYNKTYFELEPDPGYGYADNTEIVSRVKAYAAANGLTTLYNAGAQKPTEQTGAARAYALSSVDTDNIITLTMTPASQSYMGSMAPEEYVAFVAFKIKDTPPDGEGVDSFKLGRESDTNSIAMGYSTNKVAIAYNEASALETLLVLDESEADIFPEMYTVNFYNDSALTTTVSESVTVEKNSTVSADNVPAKDQFTAPTNEFYSGLKYFVDADGTGTADPDTDSDFVPNTGEESQDPPATTITGNTKVYAVYEQGYKVNFHKNDGTDTGKIIYVDKNGDGKVTIPEDVEAWTRENYVLTGWTKGAADGDAFNPETDVITEDTDLYAQWSENITITFNYNYDGATDALEVYVQPNTALGDNAPAEPTRENYVFKGWDTKGNGTGTRYTTDTIKTTTDFGTNTTLYAIWEVKDTIPEAQQVTIKFDAAADGVTVTPSSITVVQGDTIIAAQMPDTPERADYEFAGWYESASISDTNKITAPITADKDKTLFAHWTYTGTDAVTVTFNALDADTPINNLQIKIGNGDTVGDAMPTGLLREGYSFDKWTDESDAEFTGETPVTKDTTVTAQWTSDITINFDINYAADTTLTPISGKPTDTATFATPTRENYQLVGWNTERNGSGKYIADGQAFNDIKTESGASGDEITLYAQWAAVDPDDISTVKDDDTPVSPAADSVRIEFLPNVGNNTPVPAVTPQYKYVKIDDIIGIDADKSNLPTVGERTGYKFVGWNTKANATVGNVNEITPISESLGFVTDENGDNVLKLYAIWEVDTNTVPEENRATVSYMYNYKTTDTDDEYTRQTVVKGDSVAALPDDPTNEGFVFQGWYTKRYGANEIPAAADKFTENTAVEVNSLPVYAKWKQALYIKITSDTVTYDGAEKPVEFEVYVMTPDENGSWDNWDENQGMTKLDLTEQDIADNFIVTYDNSTNVPTSAGDHSVIVTTTGDYAAKGMEVELMSADIYTIEPADVTLTIDAASQKVKKATGSAAQDLLKYTLDPSSVTGTVEYRLWTDDGNGTIESNELSAPTQNPTEIGKYVATVKLADSNYAISSVSGNVYTDAQYNKGTDGEGNYIPVDLGTNIMFEIAASDPSISAPVINATKSGSATGDPLELKSDDTYNTPIEFVTGEDPSTDTYYVRVEDTEADGIQFVFTPESDTTVVTAPAEGVTKNDDGSYTVTAPLTSKGGTPNTITITTKNGDGDDAPTQTYTFYVQQLVEAKIELNYGNSPYGEIMRAANIADEDKEAAKTAFNAGNTFKGLEAKHLPTGLSTDVVYTAEAWGGSTDSDVNMDRNEYAIFGYEATEFFDTGFTATDSLGNDVTANVVRTIDINLLTGYDINEEMGEANKTSITIPAGSDNSLNAIVDSDKVVRPDVYEMKYTFTDSIKGEITASRKIIVIPLLGDVDLQDGVNNNDTVPIVSQVQRLGDIINTAVVEERVANLFLYRVCDTDYQDGINNNDTVPIVSQVQRLGDIVNFYNSTTAN